MTTPFLVEAIISPNNTKIPVWFLRQAGRYLPEYRNIRNIAGNFLTLCKTPKLALEVTMQPIKRFDLDAAIIFSDILVVPNALGLELDFLENEGPKFFKPIKNIKDIENLKIETLLLNLDYVFELIELARKNLEPKKALIGFSGSPFTLACYMIEGSGSKSFLEVKKWMYNHNKEFHLLLDLLADSIILYLNKQIDSGVDITMIFDSWGGILSYYDYEEFSLKYIKKIIDNLKIKKDNRVIPSIVFSKGCSSYLEIIKTIGMNVVAIDWLINIFDARKMIPKNISIQGNLDPGLLACGDFLSIEKQTNNIINDYKRANDGRVGGLIFNVGHGIIKSTPVENVAKLVDLIRNTQ